MAGPLFKLVGVLGIDATQFEKGISTAKTTLGGFGGGAQAAFKVVGTAAAIGFGFATKGALEAERAQGAFMSATGKTREEAKKFVSQMDSLAGTSGTVGKTFEEIAATGTMVAQQFQVTGDEATELTSDILKFAKVTGQDATSAAGALEDTLSSFGLGAKDAAGLMDMLKKSSQDFGTDAGPAAVDALRNMAPALSAMGEGLDYGIGALNLFETAGLDAATGQIAFNKAVDDIPPGGSFDDIIAKLGAIEDPLARDSAAVEIFGEKAGHKMALAIKPGMTSLDDFRVSAEEAAGTVDQASDDMLTFGDRIKGFADKALAGAREVGNEFGPALTGLASLGSLAAPFAKGLKGLFSGLIAKVLPSAVAVGTATGAAEAEAHVAGATGAGFLTKIKGAFGSLIGKIIPSAAATGAATGAAEAEAHVAASTGVGLVGKIKGAFAALIGKVVPSAIAVGVATGTAEGEAHAVAATGPSVVANLFGRIAAMAIPLAPAGTTIGTAVGGAAAVAFPIAFAAGAILLGGPVAQDIGNKMGRSMFGAIADQMGSTEARGIFHDTFVDTLGDEFGAGIRNLDSLVVEFDPLYDAIGRRGEQGMNDAINNMLDPQVFKAAYDKAIAEGLPPEEAYKAGWAAAEAAAAGFAGGVTSSGSWGSTIGPGYVEWMHSLATTSEQGGTASALSWNSAFKTQYESGNAALIDDASLQKTLHAIMVDAHKDAAWGGAQTPREFAQGARSTFDAVTGAFTDLKKLMKDTLSPTKQIAELEGIATSKLLAKGLRDGRPEVRGEAQQIALDTLAELHKLQPGSAKIGELTTRLLAEALPNERPALQDAIAAIVGVVKQPLSNLPGIAENTGASIGRSLARGLDAMRPIVRTAADGLARIVTNHLQIDSPAKEGIWSKGGGPMVRLFASGKKLGMSLVGGLGSTAASLSTMADRIAKAVMPGLGGLRPPSLRLPVMPPLAAPGLALAGGGGASGGIHIHFHGPVVTDRATLNKLGEDIENARRQFVRGANRQSGR